MNIPTLAQWQRGLRIVEQIAALEKELKDILGGAPAPAPSVAKAAPKASKPARRKLSPQAIANIRAAQKKRWAKVNALKKAPASAKKSAKAKPAKAKAPQAPNVPAKKKRKLSPEVRARLAAAMKARWDAAKKSGGPAPTAPKA
jgi:uncharacterized membrane protein